MKGKQIALVFKLNGAVQDCVVSFHYLLLSDICIGQFRFMENSIHKMTSKILIVTDYLNAVHTKY